MSRTYAIVTPKLCQGRKAAAIRDACNRRELRFTLFKGGVLAMPGFGDLLQKAVYLGVGLASYAGEKASSKLGELRTEAQKLADELVKRGEMTTDEGRRFVDDMMRQAQQQSGESPSEPQKLSEPRRIEIVSEDEEPSNKSDEGVDRLRQQVQQLQDELRDLKQD